MFFSSWMSIVRTLVVGALAYTGLVALLRISGNRTLSKMNAFDLIVTVALGSTLATVLLTKSVALVDGLLAFALLIGLQFVVTWLSVRSSTISHLVKSEPVMLAYHGEMMHDAMRRARVVDVEVLAAVREAGLGALDETDAIVLETDGTLSVIKRAPDHGPGALAQVSNAPADLEQA